MNACIIFGEFVRKTRLANRISGREAADAVGMLPSNFSKLEHGLLNPPRDGEKQKALADAIGLKNPDERAKFFDFAGEALKAVPADIAEIISEEDALPLLLRTIGNKRLSKEAIKRLVEIVRGAVSDNISANTR